MFTLEDGTLVLSASDVTDALACGHLAGQKLAIARGERSRPRPDDDPHLDVLRRRGDEHEAEHLARLTALHGECVDLTREVRPWVREELEAAAAATADAIRDRAPLIFQPVLFDGRWYGRADFLVLTGSGYEVVDTKLARACKPSFVHQLALYSRLLAEITGVVATHATIILGDDTPERIDLRRTAALHRAVVARVERLADDPAPDPDLPEPVSHCTICPLSGECDAQRRAVDHLGFVAKMRRDQREKVALVDITTLADLAAAPSDLAVPRLGADRFDLLRHQARLQVQTREHDGAPTHRHLDPLAAHGYARLPEPDGGDLFFDLEGDPWASEHGLEYLWGWCDVTGAYACLWSHDEQREKAAFEAFVDFVVARRSEHPGMHVFHYAAHELVTLRNLALRHATREDEVDDLLRAGVFVDLYAVVRQALQVGEESYSLKRLEHHHGFIRLEKSVRDGGGSVVAYEEWLASQDAAILEAIRSYNAEDCRSTLSLRDWLFGVMRPEAAAAFVVDFATLEPEPEPERTPPAWLEEIEPLIDQLLDGLPEDPEDDDTDAAERRLLAYLLRYHQREGKPEWWRHFELKAMTPVQLEDEVDAIGSLERDRSIEPVRIKQSLEYAYTFPPQEFKLGEKAFDPEGRTTYSNVRTTETHVYLRRRASDPAPAPHALIPSKPIDPVNLRDALAAIARAVLDGDPTYAGARSVLRRAVPQVGGAALEQDVPALVSATLALTGSHLPVQGPPGTGKTYRAARMIVAALRDDRRVAITAPSHKAIQNLLTAVEKHAHKVDFPLRGIYKGDGYESPHGLVTQVDTNAKADTGALLVAGTPYLLSRPEHRGEFGLLFADEASQMSLANLVACGTCADSIVMLGDPQQLPQVTKASHPGGSGESALGHLLGDADTIDRTRGVLLTQSWRMHPEISAFVSDLSYTRLLGSVDDCTRRRIDAPGELFGAGLRLLAVEHTGCSQSSIEEARAIASACEDLLTDGKVTDRDGTVRDLVAADIMVVAPYNLAVRLILEHVPDGVQVGTVDKFQGREAPVVFYALTCSTGDDVPRGIEFLFSRNRLNVAISRAQALAVLVHNPALLEAQCRRVADMELVDGVCRLVEGAAPAVRVA